MAKKKSRRKKGVDLATIALLAIGVYLIVKRPKEAEIPTRSNTIPGETPDPVRRTIPIGRIPRKILPKYA